MNEYNALKDAIRAAIKPNGEYALTAQIFQNILIEIVDSFGKGYQFMGIATADTEPGEPDEKEFYVGFAGEYANFGSETVTVPVGGVVIFLYDTEWHANVVKIAERVAVSDNHLEIDGVRSIIEQDIVNVNTLTSQGEAFLTAAAARAAVSAESGLRIGGQVITYLVEIDEEHHTAWVVDQFTGDDAEGWENDDNWQPFLYVELAKIVSNQTQINEAIMEALGNRYTKEQIDGMIEPLSERMAAAEEGLADRYTKEQSDAITDALDERLETVEELGQIMVEGGEIGIATAQDFDNPDAAQRAKVPTVGAMLDGYVRVLQNSQTGHTDINIGDVSYPVAGAEEFDELKDTISDLSLGKLYGFYTSASNLPQGDLDGYAYVGATSPFAIYVFKDGEWSNSGSVYEPPVGNGEDINTNENNQLQFADRAYDSLNPDGMGYVILRKDKTFAEQIADKPNTIFEIRYNFDLDGETITVPDNCILKFEGGLLKNGTITSENNINLSIEAKEERIFEDVEFSSNIHLLNSDIFLNWFCKNTLTDNTQTIQKILNSFKECVLSSNTTYLVNGTIILQENQCLKFNWNSCLQKSSGTGPIIHIKGSYNSILGQGKGGFLKSSIISPNGLICVGEYGDYILDNMVCHNKIDGLILEGTISNTTDYSIGMLCKNTGYNVGAYRNSISNVDIRFFNIGVAIRGGFNGNFLRDMQFYACGGDYPPLNHTRTDDEAPIIVESWDTPQGVGFDWGEVLENTISNINVGYSPNTIALLFVGSVKWHMVDNFVAEQEGLNALEFSWREKNHNGTDYIPKWNSVAIAGNTYLGPNSGGDFQNYNTYLSTYAMSFGCPSITGQNLRAKQQLRVQDRYIDDNQDSWIGRNTQTVKYGVSDGEKYILGRLALRNGYGTEGVFLRIIFTSISGGYIGLSSVFNILIIRRENNTIESKVWGKYWDEGYRLLEIVKNSNNTIDIEFKAPSFGVTGTSLMRATTEFYTRNDCTFTLNSSATISSSSKSVINCAPGGWSSQRPTYPEVGQVFYDKDYDKPIWWTGNAWVESDGITPHILRYGSTSQRPAFADIYKGFKYYDTTLNMEIINDNGTWVDANGRTPGKHSGELTDLPNFISGTAGANDDGYMFTFTDDATYGNKTVWWNTNAGGWVDATGAVVIPII